MSTRRLEAVGLVVLRSALASAAIYYSYRYLPQFFEFWDSKQPLQWWAGRATGFAAYAILAAAMVSGLLVSSRGLDGAISRKTVTDYHQQWTIAALILAIAHTLIIVTDKYVDISLVGALVPGRSVDLTGQVAIGTLALWGMIAIILSSWLRSMMSYEVWRMIHAAATGVMLLGLAHGFLAGADSAETFARVLYLGTGAGVFGVTVFRLTYEFRKPRASPAAAASGEQATRAPRVKPVPPAAPAPEVHGATADVRPADANSTDSRPAHVLNLAAARHERTRLDAETQLP